MELPHYYIVYYVQVKRTIQVKRSEKGNLVDKCIYNSFVYEVALFETVVSSYLQARKKLDVQDCPTSRITSSGLHLQKEDKFSLKCFLLIQQKKKENQDMCFYFNQNLV